MLKSLTFISFVVSPFLKMNSNIFKFKKTENGEKKNGIINLMQNAFCLAQSLYCSGQNLS